MPSVSEARARLAAYILGKIARRSLSSNRNYRVVRVDELRQWEKYKGFIPQKSRFGRLSMTANPYLAWIMLDEKIRKRAPEITSISPGVNNIVMLEIDTSFAFLSLKRFCPPYSCLAMGVAWPSSCVQKEDLEGCLCDPKLGYDIFVSEADLLLAECFEIRKVPLIEIRKIYIPKEADEETRREAIRFAKDNGIPYELDIPRPDKATAKYLRTLLFYLESRGLPKLERFLAVAKEYDKAAYGVTCESSQ